MNESQTYIPSAVSNKFSLKRCMSYLRLYAAGNKRTALLMFLAVTGVLTIAFCIQNLNNYMGASEYYLTVIEGNKRVIVAVFLMFFSALSCSKMFNHLSSKNDRLSFLTIPALTSEKFWVRMFVHIPVFILMFFVAVAIADILRWTLFTCLPGTVALPISGADLYLMPGIDRSAEGLDICKKLMQYVTLISFYSLGSILFPRMPFIKSIVYNLIFWIIFGSLIALSIYIFIGDVAIMPRFGLNWSEEEAKHYLTIISVCIQAFLTLFMFSLTYLRLKESEVINRW